MAVNPHGRVKEMEMRIRESNGTFKVTITSLAGQELAVYREFSGGVTFELREVEEEAFEEAAADAYVNEVFELERVPLFKSAVVSAVSDDEEAEIRASVAEEARNNALFHKLSGLRRALASEAKVPPYLIFHDKTLWGMVEKMPVDLFSLGNIIGVGKSKLEKYGDMFLTALQEGA